MNPPTPNPKVYESVGRPSLERPFRRVRKTTWMNLFIAYLSGLTQPSQCLCENAVSL
ncbi:MAG: hypothetical protein F6K28_18725 [Microcoleus sp. SIO2G3]|nr:hypothetical protein [Microcoleus sp. SIO2G3]